MVSHMARRRLRTEIRNVPSDSRFRTRHVRPRGWPGRVAMRILLVIDGMHPRDGGPPRVVVGSANALRARALDVAVLTTLQPGDEDAVRSVCRPMLDSGVDLHFC